MSELNSEKKIIKVRNYFLYALLITVGMYVGNSARYPHQSELREIAFCIGGFTFSCCGVLLGRMLNDPDSQKFIFKLRKLAFPKEGKEFETFQKELMELTPLKYFANLSGAYFFGFGAIISINNSVNLPEILVNYLIQK